MSERALNTSEAVAAVMEAKRRELDADNLRKLAERLTRANGESAGVPTFVGDIHVAVIHADDARLAAKAIGALLDIRSDDRSRRKRVADWLTDYWIRALSSGRGAPFTTFAQDAVEVIAIATGEAKPAPGAGCQDCGRAYTDPGFPDLLIPNWAWEKIMPGRGGGGLLCPSCIVARCVNAGLSDVPCMWASGPLICEPYRDGDNGGVEWLRAERPLTAEEWVCVCSWRDDQIEPRAECPVHGWSPDVPSPEGQR